LRSATLPIELKLAKGSFDRVAWANLNLWSFGHQWGLPRCLCPGGARTVSETSTEIEQMLVSLCHFRPVLDSRRVASMPCPGEHILIIEGNCGGGGSWLDKKEAKRLTRHAVLCLRKQNTYLGTVCIYVLEYLSRSICMSCKELSMGAVNDTLQISIHKQSWSASDIPMVNMSGRINKSLLSSCMASNRTGQLQCIQCCTRCS
jgi:hypothetical protein